MISFALHGGSVKHGGDELSGNPEPFLNEFCLTPQLTLADRGGVGIHWRYTGAPHVVIDFHLPAVHLLFYK